MKTVHVAAAVICDDREKKSRIFATARGYGEYRGWWEFPGGKLEPGETARAALLREIREELDVTVDIGDQLDTVEYDYPAFHLRMDCFWCTVADGEIVLKEAAEARWLRKEELDAVRWLPADRDLVEKIRRAML